MTLLLFLGPFSVGLGLLGLWGFAWSVRARQYDDPKGDAARILQDHLSSGPAD
jgi:cbb3-type cytochrome oxidase maturation protein